MDESRNLLLSIIFSMSYVRRHCRDQELKHLLDIPPCKVMHDKASETVEMSGSDSDRQDWNARHDSLSHLTQWGAPGSH